MIDESKLLEYVNKLYNEHKNYYAKNFPNLTPPTFSINFGKKYGKVIRDNGSQKSVHCFVDLSNGDLLKAASWKIPTKGKRGNITDENPPLQSGDFYIKY